MALPHTLLIPEGSRGRAKSAKSSIAGRQDLGTVEWLARVVPGIKEGQRCCPFFVALVFSRRNANWEKDKMLSIFPFH